VSPGSPWAGINGPSEAAEKVIDSRKNIPQRLKPDCNGTAHGTGKPVPLTKPDFFSPSSVLSCRLLLRLSQMLPATRRIQQSPLFGWQVACKPSIACPPGLLLSAHFVGSTPIRKPLVPLCCHDPTIPRDEKFHPKQKREPRRAPAQTVYFSRIPSCTYQTRQLFSENISRTIRRLRQFPPLSPLDSFLAVQGFVLPERSESACPAPADTAVRMHAN